VVLTASRAKAMTAATSREAWLVVIQDSPDEDQQTEQVGQEGPQTVVRRREIADELIAVAEQIEDTERAYAGHEYRFHALLEVGDAATARQAFEAMTRIAEEIRRPAQLWFAGVNRAKLALFEGRFGDADGLIREAFELGQHDWTANPQMAFDLQMYQLQRERGLLAEMVDVVERAVEEHPTYPVWSYVLLDVETELGREDRARATFERLAAEGFPLYLEMQWLFGMSLLPEVCRYLDDPEGASTVYDRLRPFGHLNATLPPELCRGSVSRGLGILAATMGRWSEAVEHFQVALRMNAGMGRDRGSPTPGTTTRAPFCGAGTLATAGRQPSS
jgi:tetratricopeptide (TPR) repeat protein